MQDAHVRERVERLLQQSIGDERMLDAYWQWATNPTGSAAGYAIEENCGFIATNLLTRYGQPAIAVVSRLAEECRKLSQRATIDEIQQAIIAVINGPVGQVLRAGILMRLNHPVPSRRLLAGWLINRAHWYGRIGEGASLAGELDWCLGLDLLASGCDLKSPIAGVIYGKKASDVDLSREAVAVGVANRLLYRSNAGHMEPKLRPGARFPLSVVEY